jgi:hypothetical protein
MNDEEQTKSPNGADRLIEGVSDAVSLSLRIGATLARMAAQATAGDRMVPAPRRQDSPINAIVHYSIATVVNIVDTVVESVQDVRQASAGSPIASAQPGRTVEAQTAAAPAHPTVHRGATLRIPLSIENPGPEPMVGLRFTCPSLSGGDSEAGLPLSPTAIRFEPETLTVAPKDFDKLTVYVDVPADAASGRYVATIALSDGTFETSLQFEVV